MVNYLCKYCNKNYNSFEEAEKCEVKGLIGPDIKPGLLFSYKEKDVGFLVFYNEQESFGHERVYFMEEIFKWSTNHISGIQRWNFKTSDLEKYLKNYRVATDEETKNLNEKISEGIMGISGIRAYMEKFEIKKLHNNFDLECYLASIKKITISSS